VAVKSDAGRYLDQALATARLKSRQQAGRALAHVRAALPPGLPGLGGLFAGDRVSTGRAARTKKLDITYLME
jgi:hypothetical protein